MIWATIAAYGAVMAAAAGGASRFALVVIVAFYLGVQGLKLHDLDGARTALFFAAWAICAGWLLKIGADANSRLIVTMSALTLFSAACYLIGAVLGQPHYLDGLRVLSHLFWADLFMVAAITIGGIHGVVRIFRDIAGRSLGAWGY